ncbi:MAG: transporter substrate-binding domain-containing protein [Synergistaceae bacterium]|nr:transporter substrate-binding domain-containing protein [Synergistaceae bacterium]
MKKLFAIAFVFILAFVYAGFHFASSRTRIFRVGTECDLTNSWEEEQPTDTNVPLANKEGFYVEGYDIQIAKIVAKSIGAKLEVKKLPYQELIPALNRREIDAIFSGMLDTSARKKVIAFSDVYDIQDSEYGIVVHKNGKYVDAKTLKDFIGATFIAQKDTNFDRAIAQIRGAIHLPSVTQIKEVFDKLQNNEADATVLDLDSAHTYERVYPNFTTIKFSAGEGFKFDYTGICAGVRRNDTKLIKEINDALSGLSKHDRQKIMDKSIAREWENL